MKVVLRWLFIPILLIAMMCAAMPVFASSDEYSLKVSFMKADHKLPLDGAQISIYQVADADIYDSWAVFKVKEEYASLRKVDDTGHETTFDGLTASQSIALAKEFAKLVKNPVKTGVTDKNGNVMAEGLTPGMYLVVQTGKSGTAEGYEMFQPFLVLVPMYEEGIWVKNVTVEPKTGVKPVETETPATPTPSTSPKPSTTSRPASPTPKRSNRTTTSPTPKSTNRTTTSPTPKSSKNSTTPAKTGDPTDIWVWIRLMAASGCVLMCFAFITAMRKKRGDEHA